MEKMQQYFPKGDLMGQHFRDALMGRCKWEPSTIPKQPQIRRQLSDRKLGDISKLSKDDLLNVATANENEPRAYAHQSPTLADLQQLKSSKASEIQDSYPDSVTSDVSWDSRDEDIQTATRELAHDLSEERRLRGGPHSQALEKDDWNTSKDLIRHERGRTGKLWQRLGQDSANTAHEGLARSEVSRDSQSKDLRHTQAKIAFRLSQPRRERSESYSQVRADDDWKLGEKLAERYQAVESANWKGWDEEKAKALPMHEMPEGDYKRSYVINADEKLGIIIGKPTGQGNRYIMKPSEMDAASDFGILRAGQPIYIQKRKDKQPAVSMSKCNEAHFSGPVG
ncbi:MAG: hypothetical protein V4568_19310, partial [Pseudomonadota bacterium]